MPRGKSQKRRRDEDEEEDEEEQSERFKRASKYLDVFAAEADSDEDESDVDAADDGFFVDDPAEEIPEDDDEVGDSVQKPSFVARRHDDDEVDVEAIEKMVNERYGAYGSAAAEDYEDVFDEEASEVEQCSLLPSVTDPKLWMVKCSPGREREVAACLMQKSVDVGPEMRILSAIALEHLQNYIYVEAHKEAYVKEACKGMRYIFPKNITMVPMKEMSSVLSVESKRPNVSEGDWVRLKRSNYKGSLAKVVRVDGIRQKVTVKVIPRLSSLSLSDRQEGVNSLYKTVGLKSVVTGDIHPSLEEMQNLSEIGEADVDLATLFLGKDKRCLLKGDAVVIVKGELKNLEGTIEFVEGDIVHVRPKEKLPMKTVAVRKQDLARCFEPGCHVKVVHGVNEGATGLVIKVDQNKIVILSDASKEHITVLSGQVIESEEISKNSSAVGVGVGNQERPSNSSAPRHVPRLAPANRSMPERFSSPAGQRPGQFSKRHDSLLGKDVKIIKGSYRGYHGCIKGVNGKHIRLELKALMKIITVEYSHISDKVERTSSDMRQGRAGAETPLHPRTPMHSMGGETPWRTPTRTPLHSMGGETPWRTPFKNPSDPPTPVHRGSATLDQWNTFRLGSPRLIPTP